MPSFCVPRIVVFRVCTGTQGQLFQALLSSVVTLSSSLLPTVQLRRLDFQYGFQRQVTKLRIEFVCVSAK